MTLAAFKRTLSNRVPPKGLSPPLQALWWAEKGDWNRAHALVNNADGRDEDQTRACPGSGDHSQVGQARLAWVHAHLHRVEGDLMNARYWYGKAGRALAENSLAAERDEIARELLGGK
jgi:hypothetical protein